VFLLLRILPIQTVAAAHLFPPKLPRSDGPADELKSAADSRAECAFFDSRTPTNPAHVTSKRSVNKVRPPTACPAECARPPATFLPSGFVPAGRHLHPLDFQL
jgi:hypothetical protein